MLIEAGKVTDECWARLELKFWTKIDRNVRSTLTHQRVKVMLYSNPAESPEFFRFIRQLLKLSSKCEDHIFIWGSFNPCRIVPCGRFQWRWDIVSVKLKIKRISWFSSYLLKRWLLKCSAWCLQVFIHSGLSNDWISAIPSTMATLNCTSAFGELVWRVTSLLDSPVSFSSMCIRALLHGQWSIVPSGAKRDHGTTENSYRAIASLMSTSGRLLQIIVSRAKTVMSGH